ncbi:X-ray radiation resistance-associated protein 1 isoform X2 [Nerophis lumbriciformis]|uniref:X-ray radiation resistance-associated protein 1 isoform X2 n=1 Tax=Nerophis lumbriciformis TaxID=546530 RepID=UPI002ADF5A5D|nr:X-ray radiation resistance-associated protein 1 isoform X2 [Nerophis lumbriciformis]
MFRTLMCQKEEGASHWLIAFRKAEEHKSMTLCRRQKESCDKEKSCHGCYTLDRDFLLQLHEVGEPSELCTVNISEQKLDAVKPEDLKAFDNVAYVDASINSLSLDSFGSFVSLKELNLAVNGLCNVAFDAIDFPHLQVLDLSYNCLSADDVVSFSRLPLLKVLHLTGNELCLFPPHLGSQYQDPLSSLHTEDPFNALEVLMLDDNKLSSEVFGSLSALKRLKHLNLQGNRITKIPYLNVMTGCSRPVQTPLEKEGRALDEQRSFSTMSQESDFLRALLSPLPELQFLDLSHNKIAEEEALLPASVFSKLREIDIRSNALTTKKSGNLPLLTYYLQEKMGITVTCKDVKHGLQMSASTHQKVAEVLHKPLLLHERRPARIQFEKEKLAVGSKSNFNTDEHVFVTKANIFPEDDQTSMRLKDNAAPEGFSPSRKKKMGTKSDPDVVRPVGIQTAVQMLERTLKNLNIYRLSKPKLDSIQTPYRPRLKQIKEPPPLRPRQSELLDEIIKDLRCRNTGTGLRKREHKEALKLLRDLETQHKLLHRKAM